MKRQFFLLFIGTLAIFFDISIFRDGRIVLSVLLALIFFRPIEYALIFAAVSGCILDLYSPLFGIRSILAILLTLCVHHLSMTLFTNRSLFSFLFLGLIASLIFSGLFSGIGWGAALITGNDTFLPIVSFESFRQGIISLMFQGITLSMLYPLFSRSAPEHLTSLR